MHAHEMLVLDLRLLNERTSQRVRHGSDAHRDVDEALPEALCSKREQSTAFSLASADSSPLFSDVILPRPSPPTRLCAARSPR